MKPPSVPLAVRHYEKAADRRMQKNNKNSNLIVTGKCWSIVMLVMIDDCDDSDDYEKHGDTDEDIVLNYDRLYYNSILHSS